jgi:twitching motility protein PilT
MSDDRRTGSRDRVVAGLRHSPLFQSLADEHLRKVESFAAVVSWPGGEVMFREGEPSDSFLILLDGAASVRVTQKATGEQATVARLAPPDVVGEGGLILSEPRTATVVAEGPVTAARFDAGAFTQMFAKVPGFGIEVCRLLARRLAATSHRIPLQAADEGSAPDPDAMSRLPLPFLRRHEVVPLRVRDGALVLGFVGDPSTQVLDGVRRLLPGLRIEPVRIRREVLETALRAAPESGSEGPARAATVTGVRDAPQALEALLRRVVEEGASDLHLSAGHLPRWRVDGEIREIEGTGRLAADDALAMLRPLFQPSHAQAWDAGDEVDFAHGMPGLARFRVNVFRDGRGTCAVLRQIPEKVIPLDRLNLPPAVARLCDNARGLVLVTGPTGSGKSTTLAAMIDQLNRTRRGHILTLEDPVEFVHESQGCLVNQREVGTHTRAFSRALRAALREDPDIVLVGEMRDLETISLAIETANTGHLVFGTLHTSTAVGTVDRIVNLFPAEQQAQIRATLGDTLRGVISQALCRRIGGGRVGAYEVLVVNAGIANLIREGKTHQIASLMSTGAGQGNVMLNQALSRLVREKLIEPDEAMRQAVDKADLARVLGPGS